ncbi:MAG: type II toxin-antitoxin system VapB family antitoxin [Acidimicrobiaceae bacterium]|nr:type II toxin-antitoxin system VapB family antitoxin [Acidimicrobiaceae bacterium]MDE0676759.1 type II toxin-antitoxin system VapB family antitoxin [Acidimicrobiaceae bacterium]
MARTNIDIDDEACGRVMRQYGLRTKREAVNLALRSLDAEPMCLNEAHAAQNTGRPYDLDVECAAKLDRLQSTAEMSASEIIGWGIELVEQWHAERCRERLDAVLASGFVGCLSAAPSDLAQDHRRYLDEAFGASDDAG